MKSAIEWLMGKSDSFAINNGLNSNDAVKESSLFNGDYNKEISHYAHYSNGRPNGVEKTKSPWGQSLTPRRQKVVSAGKSASADKTSSFIRTSNDRTMPPLTSWEDISFSSDILSPGFASRIAKESRGIAKRSPDLRRDQKMKKYPVGQEKLIRAGVLPNVRLKSRAKPVIASKHRPTAFLPVPSLPFASNLTSSFLASSTTRVPDISSVVSVLDSEPSTSACDTVNDPTNVKAVVSALEQAQALKSGIKRSRYVELDDSNKKQRFLSNTDSGETVPECATPIMNQVFCTGTKRTRNLDGNSSFEDGGSPTSASSQLSPENKRRCIPDPRIASFSSYKNVYNHSPTFPGSGRETPYSTYDSQQDSDSESNRSLDSRHSRLSDKSSKNYDSILPKTSERVEVSESNSPQTQSGVFGLGGRSSNGSSTPSSSRTTTPSSRLSHTFSIEAYRQDKAKSHQRLNKMLGMLFNVPEEEIEATNREIIPVSSSGVNTSLGTSSLSSSEISFGCSSNCVISENDSVSGSLVFGQLPKPPAYSAPTNNISSNKNDMAEKQNLDNNNLTPCISTIDLTPSEVSIKSPPIYSCATTDSVQLSGSSSGSTGNIITSPGKNVGLLNVSTSDKSPVSTFLSNSVASVSPTMHSTSTASKILSDIVSLPPSMSSASSINPLKSLAETTFSINKNPLFTFGSSKSSDISNVTITSSLSTTSQAAITTTSSLGLFAFGSTGNNAQSTSSESTTTSSLSFPSTTQISSITANLFANKSPSLDSKGSLAETNKSGMFSFGSQISSNNSPKEANKISMFTFDNSKVSSKNTDTQVNKSLFTFGSSEMSAKEVQLKTNITSQNEIPSTTSVSSFTVPSFGFSKIPALPSDTTNQTSSAASVFSFGSGGSITSATSAICSTTNSTNLFSFGSSNTGSVKSKESSAFEFKSPESKKEFSTDKQPISGFNFASSEQKSTFSISSCSASGLFGSSPTFTFAPDSAKISSINPLQSSTTTVSSSSQSTASNMFTFGKTDSKPDNSPFSFGGNSTPKTVPQFSSNPGGGFSFGGSKSSTASNVPSFGSPSTSVSASFTFKPPASKSSGFDFGSSKPISSSSSAAVFSFGSDKGPSSQSSNTLFGSTTAGGNGMFGSSSTKPSTSAFTFGSPQSPPSFGSASALSSNATGKSMFGGMNNNNNASGGSILFGTSTGTTASPFSGGGTSQSASPFNINPASPPSIGSPFGSNTGVSMPVQGKASVQNSPFAFSPQNPSANVFQFGSSQGSSNPVASAVPNFGGSATGMFNFGSGNSAPVPSGGGTNASNPFNITPNPSPSSTRTYVTARRMRSQHKRK